MRIAALALCVLGALSACDLFTDAATRLAQDIESAEARLGRAPGSRHTLEHRTPSKPGDCAGPYMVQMDKVGALSVWCKDDAGQTVSGHSTSYHARFVDTPQTTILEKPARSSLFLELERRGARAVIVEVR